MSETEQKPSQALTMRAGAKAAAIVPETFDECYRMAKLFAMTKMVPKDFQDNPEACCLAILQGLEVGLSPMSALQSIAVINGRPSIWGDGALAIVRASGLVESFVEADDGTVATCTIQRKGEAAPVVRKFSQDDAKKAGLAGKTGPWTQYPQRMRQMRARSWAMRDGFADVLKGLHIAEEQQDVPMRDITPRVIPEIPDIPDEPAKQLANEPEATDEPIVEPSAFLANLAEELTFATSGGEASIREVWEANQDIVADRLSRSDRAKAEALYDHALAKTGAKQAAE